MRTNCNHEELNKRASEVFELQEGDHIYDIYVENGEVIVEMSEIDHDSGRHVIFNYKPDMTERPEALNYLLGLRDDFND